MAACRGRGCKGKTESKRGGKVLHARTRWFYQIFPLLVNYTTNVINKGGMLEFNYPS